MTKIEPLETVAIRALCILAHAEHNPLWAGWNPHDKRVKWARGVVRQVAEQPMGKIDEGVDQ